MKKRIVLLNSCKGLYGGIESFLLNVFRCLDRDIFDVTFLTCGISTYDLYKDEIKNKGGKIDCVNTYPNNLNNQYVAYNKLKEYFYINKPNIVHINSSALSFQILASTAASKAKVPQIILHSHNFVPNIQYLKKSCRNIFKPILTDNGTSFLACSKDASEWMFEKKIKDKVIIIPNGINISEFRFNRQKRDLYRKEFSISDDTTIIGHVGRFQKQKNHKFIIDIFVKYLAKNPKAVLMLAGEGELKSVVMEYAYNKGILHKVVFLGERNDMGSFFAAMDIFVFPSLFEGFGIAALEAQAAGIPTFVSNTVTNEVNVTGNVHFLPINDSEIWSNEILKARPNHSRERFADLIIDAGYDKVQSGKRMQNIYLGRY